MQHLNLSKAFLGCWLYMLLEQINTEWLSLSESGTGTELNMICILFVGNTLSSLRAYQTEEIANNLTSVY